VLGSDIHFTNPSRAATFVDGDWSSGTQVWKNAEGLSVGEYEKSVRKFRFNQDSTTEEIVENIASMNTLSDTKEALKELSTILPPERVRRVTNGVVRDPESARRVKEEREYICEVCDRQPFTQKSGKPYAEADHIKPLGGGHNGLDSPENMRCLCAQCHAVVTHGSSKSVKALLKDTKWDS